MRTSRARKYRVQKFRDMVKEKRECKKLGYDSNFEVAIGLDLEDKCAEAKYHPGYIPYVIHTHYEPDWILLNGIIIEAKGELQQEDRRKHRILKDCYPDLDIRFVFDKPHSVITGGKISKAQWCERNKILWADRVVPNEWLKEPPNEASLILIDKLLKQERK